ncbi:MAG: adenine phosphoribosyltransferase [Dehalococcoidia bacterium]|nr:adenine phosphoribosyltransferase [Dehalococcoidia bacterium]
MELGQFVRDVADFPQKGILFKDITPLLGDAGAFRQAVGAMAEPWRGQRIGAVVAIEARGYILGAPMALELGAGFVPVRKVGKLPSKTYRVEYALEYGSSVIEMHVDAVTAGQRVLIVDDVLATGGTLAACVKLLSQARAHVVGASMLIELSALGGWKAVPGMDVRAVLKY